MTTVLGCAAIGGLYRPVSEQDAHAAQRAARTSVCERSTWPTPYDAGQSEEYLGSFLRDKPRHSYVPSIKVGRLLVDDPAAFDGTDGFFGTPARSRVRDYSGDGVRRSLEE